MAEGKEFVAGDFAEREIVVARVFDAPPRLVFSMWTDAKHIAQWWGPKGFTTTISEMDVRPGGVWRYVMHGPDGVDYPNENVFLDVVKPERLVYSHLSDPQFQMTITFEPQGNKTKVTARMLFDSAAERGKIRGGGISAGEGLKQTLERLGELLSKTVHAKMTSSSTHHANT